MPEPQLRLIHDDRADLSNWWPGTPEEEFRDGYQIGWDDVSERITRGELTALMSALRFGRSAFFGTLRGTSMLRDEPAANGSFAEFERLMVGPYGNGIGGDYATGYIRAFETFWIFARSLH